MIFRPYFKQFFTRTYLVNFITINIDEYNVAKATFVAVVVWV